MEKMAYYACLWRAVAQKVNSVFFNKLFDIIINKKKQQITKNEENLFLEKAKVPVVTLNKDLDFRSLALMLMPP